MEEWLEENKDTPECLGFYIMDSRVKRNLKQYLVSEQYYLCAYTGIEITIDNSHLEHLYPFSLCKDKNGRETLKAYDYFNLVACFPKIVQDISTLHPKMEKLDFGAFKRGNWNTHFLSPLTPDCENRFTFSIYGEISASNHNDIEVVETIKELGLHSTDLTSLRATAINSQLGLDGTPLSTEEMEFILSEIDVPNAEGKLSAFCFVIKQALKFYLYGEVA